MSMPRQLEAATIMRGFPVRGCALLASALLLRRRPLTALAVMLGGSVASMTLQPGALQVVVVCAVGLEMVTGLWRAGLEPGPGQAPPGPAPGLDDIDRLAATTLDAGVQVDVDWRGSREPLPADIDASAFRIIQEAVTNVVRHARTGQCRVSISQQDGQLSIEVTDSGRGGSGHDGGVAGTGYGITGMRERAALLGGGFSAGPRPGGGFRVAARLPVPEPAAAR